MAIIQKIYNEIINILNAKCVLQGVKSKSAANLSNLRVSK